MRKISVLALALVIATATLTQWNPPSEPKWVTSVQALVTVPRLYVDPSITDDPTKGIGSNFTININIANAENLYGWEVKMTFNPEVLLTTEASIVEGSFLSDTFGDTIFLSSVSNASGYLQIGGAPYPPYPETGAYGDGTLASITFQVIAEERGTPLQFAENTSLYSIVGGTVTQIEDFLTEDGFFDNRTTNSSPVAAFYAATAEPKVGDIVTFVASASYDLDGWLDSYRWDYGDNQSQIYLRGVNLTAQTTHVYMHAGIYTVTLTVSDNDGLTASSQEILLVSGQSAIFVTPEQGIVGTTVILTGVGAIPNDTVDIYWSEYIWIEYGWYLNYKLIGTAATDQIGDFSTSFQIPQSTLGTHRVRAISPTSSTFYDEATFFVLPSITVDPASGPVGTKITVSGTGFLPPYYSSISAFLFFDNQDFTIVMSDEKGNIQVTINAPAAAPGPHTVRALIMYSSAIYYPSPAPASYLMPEATFTLIDTTPLDLTADVGTIYFKGETAEVTVQTVFKGTMTNATSIKAELQKPDGTMETLQTELISTGLYEIRYPLNGKGSMTGHYTLVIEANYTSDFIVSVGTTITTFLVKPTWENGAPRLAAFSLASIGLVATMLVLWRREKKSYL